MEIIISILKMMLLYFIIVIAYRLMNKRHISDLSIMDLVVFLLLADLIAFSLPSSNQSFLYMLILLASLIAIQVVMTYFSTRIASIKYLFNSKPIFLITKGKLNFKEMLKRQYNLDTLLQQLREKSIKQIEDVEYASLESNGKLSILENNNDDLPIPLILDGKVEYVTLKLINKNNEWLDRILLRQHLSLDCIFYAFFKRGKLYIIKNE